MRTAIFLSGKAESGKTTVARMLEDKLQQMGYSTVIISFADYLKFVATKYFSWDGQKDKKGRTLLQKVGTDIVRAREPDFWSRTVARFIRVFQEDFDFFISDDTRFLEEVVCLKQFYLPSVTVRVKRLNFENSLTDKQRQHSSETSLDNYSFDYIIQSESGVDNLQREVEKFISECITKGEIIGS